MFRFLFVAFAALLVTTPGAAQTPVDPPGQPGVSPTTQTAQNLKRLSLEELAELDVTSVSRRVERLSDVAAAVSVIRTEDIRRSGVTTLADAMRLADAVDVARTNSGTWAVTPEASTSARRTSCWSSSTGDPSTRRCSRAPSGTCRIRCSTTSTVSR